MSYAPPLNLRVRKAMRMVEKDEVNAIISIDLNNLYSLRNSSIKISYEASFGGWTVDGKRMYEIWYTPPSWVVEYNPFPLSEVQTVISSKIGFLQRIVNVDVEYMGVPRKHRKQMKAVLAEFMERWSVLPSCICTGFCGGPNFLNAQEDFNTHISKKARICDT